MTRQRERRGSIGRRTFIRTVGAVGAGAVLSSGRVAAHGDGSDSEELAEQVELFWETDPTRLGVSLDAEALDSHSEGDGDPMTTEGNERARPHFADGHGTPFEFVGVWWNPDGHPPEGVYDVPHFDFHFYHVAESDVDDIEGSPLFGGSDVPTPVAPDQYPAGYFPDHSVVPEMGLHWFDSSAPEWSGGSFSHTNIYGSYDGDLIFVEPMITKEFLEGMAECESVTTEIATPERFPEAGQYPTAYSISHPDSDTFEVALESFEEFDGPVV